jgi:hypothetical protein
MGSLMAILAIAGIVWFWARSLRIREHVLRHCARTCKQLNVQLLDQTVALSRLALARDPAGQISLRRWYTFEFSTDGGDRCKGYVGLLGSRIECVRMEHPQGPIIIGP